ncbi:Fatty-acid amide hydrolase 2 [Orchesella cincta]|uniref:Fatty-acid amide hydrolase 2 n=1 Tax=Orchesella cincta TaxID=48709 RepID=A0A1D2M7H1_ORCCI|nr:Fatty-acid amide hydrolase 2 [Orchesella cincta]
MSMGWLTRFEIAVEEAKVDRMIESGEYDKTELEDKFPLLGVPFTIKDSFCVSGLRHTAGSYYRKDIIAAEDAEVVKSLKSVGAIPIGVTNVPELCMWWESHNTVYGRSRNPYDARHITVQGAAGSAFGIGSDIAGSIRVPSLFCGIFGHKPTSGIISCCGQQPEVKGRLVELLTTGPMARHANDLRLIFDVLIGESVHKMNNPRKSSASHSKANFSKLYHSLEIWVQAVSGAGGVPFCEELSLQKGKINPFWELVKFCFRISPHTLPAIMLGIIEKMAYIGNQLPRHKQLIEMGYSLAKEIHFIIATIYIVSACSTYYLFVIQFAGRVEDDAVLLYPSFPSPAPRHYVPLFRPADFSYCAVFNVLGVPVTQVPLGLGSKGLPLGVQIVGGMHSDHITISVAEELERAFGGWVQPSI